jgi:nucleoside-diphosphate-sugar epimerase
VTLQEISSAKYYGKGYQDIQTRVPWIENTKQELGWEPRVAVREALQGIFEAYRHQIAAARALLDND